MTAACFVQLHHSVNMQYTVQHTETGAGAVHYLAVGELICIAMTPKIFVSKFLACTYIDDSPSPPSSSLPLPSNSDSDSGAASSSVLLVFGVFESMASMGDHTVTGRDVIV